MSETLKPKHLIEDESVAWDVAHSAKDKRSIAAAKRLIDPIAAEFEDIEDADREKHAELTARVMGAHAIYPDVFRKLFHSSGDGAGLNHRELAEAVLDISESGELSLHNIVGWENDDSGERFDKDADTIESATEALLVHPPSQDFMKDRGLGHQTYLGSITKGYEYEVTVKDVTGLVSSAEYLDHEIQKVLNDFSRTLEGYGGIRGDTDKGVNKLQRVLYMLEKVGVYMPSEKDSKEFESKVLAAKNSEGTTIGDLKNLYMVGTARALELLTDDRDRKLGIYNDVISGAASTYTTPETNTAETPN